MGKRRKKINGSEVKKMKVKDIPGGALLQINGESMVKLAGHNGRVLLSTVIADLPWPGTQMSLPEASEIKGSLWKQYKISRIWTKTEVEQDDYRVWAFGYLGLIEWPKNYTADVRLAAEINSEWWVISGKGTLMEPYKVDPLANVEESVIAQEINNFCPLVEKLADLIGEISNQWAAISEETAALLSEKYPFGESVDSLHYNIIAWTNSILEQRVLQLAISEEEKRRIRQEYDKCPQLQNGMEALIVNAPWGVGVRFYPENTMCSGKTDETEDGTVVLIEKL